MLVRGRSRHHQGHVRIVDLRGPVRPSADADSQRCWPKLLKGRGVPLPEMKLAEPLTTSLGVFVGQKVGQLARSAGSVETVASVMRMWWVWALRLAGSVKFLPAAATPESDSSMVMNAEKSALPESLFTCKDQWPRISHGPVGLKVGIKVV
jgi:hypothetical protein